MHATQNPVSPAPHPPIADPLRRPPPPPPRALAPPLPRPPLSPPRPGGPRLTHYTYPAAPGTPSNSAAFPAADVLGALVLAVTGRPLLPGVLVHDCGPEVVAEFNHA